MDDRRADSGVFRFVRDRLRERRCEAVLGAESNDFLEDEPVDANLDDGVAFSVFRMILAR